MERILLIDDDEFILKLLSMKISRMNYEVITASSIKEAEECWKKGFFHFAVADLNLSDEPYGSAISWCESISLPVVVLSGSSEERVYSYLEDKKILGFIDKTDHAASQLLASYLHAAKWIRQESALVVNPSPVQLSYYCSILNDLFNQCHHVQTCEAAYEHLKNNSVALLVVNGTLPDGRGRDILDTIQKQENITDIPALVLTTSNDDEDTAEQGQPELVLHKNEHVIQIKNRILLFMAGQREFIMEHPAH